MNRKDRIYIVDFPKEYEHQCFRIISTCEKFYMFGEDRNTPSYEGADRVFIEPDRRRRHNLIIEFIKVLSKLLEHKKRISIYTRDGLLKNRIETELSAGIKGSFSFLKVFYIKYHVVKDATTFYDEPYQSNQNERLLSNVKIDLSGKWNGKWKRHGGTIEHVGIMEITQEQNKVSASMEVTFEYSFMKTVLKESLTGTIIESSNNSLLFLKGNYYSYREKGRSQSYLLDNFLLDINEDRNTLRGYFFSKKGEGYAEFNKAW